MSYKIGDKLYSAGYDPIQKRAILYEFMITDIISSFGYLVELKDCITGKKYNGHYDDNYLNEYACITKEKAINKAVNSLKKDWKDITTELAKEITELKSLICKDK